MGKNERGLSMNRPLIPSLSPSDGERAAEGRVRGWFMVPMHAQKRKGAFHDPPPSSRPSTPMGEKVPEGRLRGIPTGSWLRFTSEFWRCSLPMNPEEHPTWNIQRRTSNGSANPRSLRRSVLDVGCSMLDVRCFPSVQGFELANFHIEETSPCEARAERRA